MEGASVVVVVVVVVVGRVVKTNGFTGSRTVCVRFKLEIGEFSVRYLLRVVMKVKLTLGSPNPTR